MQTIFSLAILIVPSLNVAAEHYASLADFPFIVSLQKMGFHFCSGIILNRNRILSAASCFDMIEPFDIQSMKVVAGSSQPYGNGVEVKISGFMIHEQHVNVNVTYDAVIVELAQDLKLDNRMYPAVLTDETVDIPAKTMVNITGYNLNEFKASSVKLKFAEVETISAHDCRRFWPQKTANNQLYCAGNTGEDVCEGDAGAPMILDGKVIGYSSVLLCNSGRPSLFTKISSIRSWVQKHMSKE